MAQKRDDMTSLEYFEKLFQLLEEAGMDPVELSNLRQGAHNLLPSTDEETIAEYIDSLNAQFESIGLEVVVRGLSAAHQGTLQHAEQDLTFSMKLAEVLNNDLLLAMALIGMGLVQKKRGNLLSAEGHYLRALSILDQKDAPAEKSGALDNLANVYLAMGRSREALECYTKALEAVHAAKDANGELAILGNMGMLYQQRGEMQKAEETFKQCLDKAVSMNDLKREALYLDNLANVLWFKGDRSEAEQYKKRALDIFSKLNMHHDIYILLKSLSSLYMQMGDVKRAGSNYEQAAKLIRRLREGLDIKHYTTERWRAIAQYERTGTAYVRKLVQEELQQAEEEFLPEMDLEKKIEGLTALQIGLSMLAGEEALKSGSEKLIRHQYEKAEHTLKQALASFRMVHAYSEEAAALGDLGVLYTETGKTDLALEVLLQARNLAYETGDWLREINALSNLSRLCVENDSLEVYGLDALDLLTQAEVLMDLLPGILKWQMQQQITPDNQSQYDEAMARFDNLKEDALEEYKANMIYNNFGTLHLEHGNYARAESYFLKAVESARRSMTEEEAFILLPALVFRLSNLARLYHTSGEEAKQRKVIEQIEEVVSQCDDPRGAFMGTIVLGDYYWRTEKNAEEAYQLFKRAIDLSDIQRQQIARGEERITFVGNFAPPFDEAIILAVQLGRQVEAFELVSRAKSRQMLEELAETLPKPQASNIPSTILEKERNAFHQWIQASQVLKSSIPRETDPEFRATLYRASESLEQSLKELHELWNELEPVAPEYVSLRRGTPLSFPEIHQMVSDR